MNSSKNSVLSSVDWYTIIAYIILLAFGWISVCGATYSFDDADLFSLETRSGMQIVWIATSIMLATCLLLMDNKLYETFAYAIYAVLLLLLFATIFNPHEIKGSRSWIVLGPLRLQPAEFAKFATALAVAKFMSGYKYSIEHWKDLFKVICMIVLPMLLIIMQKETGSALVYASFFLMLYREGMTGSFLFTGIAMVAYFVIGIRFADVQILDTPTHVGPFVVLFLIQVFTSILVLVYCKAVREAKYIALSSFGFTVIAFLFSEFIIPFDVIWVQILILLATVGYLIWLWVRSRLREYMFIILFTITIYQRI